ncbi:DUF1566 domain-containing protein [Thiocystis violascens]|uniref:DUF1566 domain-containing protein n=1 Tax=Thiocystis violascens (strain ATCC 17096 / DSM 198 / 6111) TaxID=765911 RepID=I3Y8F6_THIV6|nr:DUF1566 domain-containing protein [Thiocystis violascens]AFL73274.1 Protein of unknown function (DUF1566) [Thiocystis violascens DSM 198]
MLKISFYATMALLTLGVNSAQAALIDRGSGLIYDDVLNITWLKDANFAVTSGYAATAVDTISSDANDNIYTNGSMGWGAAMTWASNLEYGGFTDWRLPSAVDKTTVTTLTFVGSIDFGGYGDKRGELGHLFSNPDLSLFLNLPTSATYWYGLKNQDYPMYAWAFYTVDKNTYGITHWNNTALAWAVHDGDIGLNQVPIPATAWLFGSALLGLVGLNRRKKPMAVASAK